jgi:hypothetical protein
MSVDFLFLWCLDGMSNITYPLQKAHFEILEHGIGFHKGRKYKCNSNRVSYSVGSPYSYDRHSV